MDWTTPDCNQVPQGKNVSKTLLLTTSGSCSYDYDAPITEQGQLTVKFNATAELIAKYNTMKTRLPVAPETPLPVKLEDLKVSSKASGKSG